ncbi:MAG: DUF3108 domain-containing protein [Flavobacteriaceae bacterium]|nr:DUF3108 domain-containing protein [Bacteroidia bacterium]NNK82156.1 DUF3108 domain-containing protein [Flavobacteriaceae bacterium]
MKNFLFIAFILFSFLGFSQNTAIGSQEKLVFTASYNMSGLLTDFAQVSMETKTVKTSKTTLLHFKCKAQTYSKWNYFFKINDTYESYVNPNTLSPYLYKRDINEGGYYKFMKYNFNQKTKTVKSLMRKKRGNGTFWEVNKSYNFGRNTNDIVTTIYKLRNLDLASMTTGSAKTFTVLFDNETQDITIKLLGKETLKTKIGTKETYKISLAINNKDLLKGTNSNLLWLTADKNKIPVYAKFKVAVGNGELRINSATGLKN